MSRYFRAVTQFSENSEKNILKEQMHAGEYPLGLAGFSVGGSNKSGSHMVSCQKDCIEISGFTFRDVKKKKITDLKIFLWNILVIFPGFKCYFNEPSTLWWGYNL